jgi:hypothetical protein
MSNEMVRRLILYIVGELQAHEGLISKIRIVKILYLIDVEYYRMYGESLTGLKWYFYRYGPYAYDIDAAINGLGFRLGEETIETAEGHAAYTYRVQESPDLDDLRFAAKAGIDRIISRWALEDLRALLDYVYTSTEPMRVAAFGEDLDFSTIRRGIHVNRPTRYLKLPQDRSDMIQELLRRRGKQREEPKITPPRYDEVYTEAVKAMDEEDMAGKLPRGEVDISAQGARCIAEQFE